MYVYNVLLTNLSKNVGECHFQISLDDFIDLSVQVVVGGSDDETCSTS